MGIDLNLSAQVSGILHTDKGKQIRVSMYKEFDFCYNCNTEEAISIAEAEDPLKQFEIVLDDYFEKFHADKDEDYDLMSSNNSAFHINLVHQWLSDHEGWDIFWSAY